MWSTQVAAAIDQMSGGVMERLLESTTLTCDKRVEELMGVGDMIKWHWYLGSSTWEATEFQGIVVGSSVTRFSDREKIMVFKVLNQEGDLCDVREDAPGLELVS